ncbi:hypothetical protein BJX76DRAFT_321070 [Aspergillus varians]
MRNRRFDARKESRWTGYTCSLSALQIIAAIHLAIKNQEAVVRSKTCEQYEKRSSSRKYPKPGWGMCNVLFLFFLFGGHYCWMIFCCWTRKQVAIQSVCILKFLSFGALTVRMRFMPTETAKEKCEGMPCFLVPDVAALMGLCSDNQAFEARDRYQARKPHPSLPRIETDITLGSKAHSFCSFSGFTRS